MNLPAKYMDAMLDDQITRIDSNYVVRFSEQHGIGEDSEQSESSSETFAGGQEILERSVFMLKHFVETGEQIDIENRLICAGSRDDFVVHPDDGYDWDGDL